MKLIFTFIIIISSAAMLNAQTIGTDTITWNSSKALNGTSTVSINSQFVLYGNSQIDWKQTNGEDTSSYQITDIVGSWSDLQKQGQVECKVKMGSREGSIFFYRIADGVRIRIDMQRNGVNLVPFEFIISDYSTSN